jgi:hypothetical protein
VSLRFRTAQPKDATVHRLFGLEEIVDYMEDDKEDDDGEGDSESSRAEETEEDIANLVHIKVNDLIGNDKYLLKMRRVLNARTHVVVIVVKSKHADFVVGSERILTLAQAQALYVAYNDLYLLLLRLL